MMDLKIDSDLSEKVALVTGATGGIGKEIARGLARLGATLRLHGVDDQSLVGNENELTRVSENRA
jgi:NAD(P)-dependent dehydrogenase (short-subunit alcohol dehydrogenase family)